MRKYILSFAVTIAALNGSEYTGYNCDDGKNTFNPSSFENGFFTGVNSIEREFNSQHNQDKTITYSGDYIVAIDISKLPKEEILILKNFGYLEGLAPITVEGSKLIFSDANRVADAKYTADMINTKYLQNKKYKAEVFNNYQKNFIKKDYIYQSILDKLKRETYANVYVVDNSKVESNNFVEPNSRIKSEDYTITKIDNEPKILPKYEPKMKPKKSKKNKVLKNKHKNCKCIHKVTKHKNTNKKNKK